MWSCQYLDVRLLASRLWEYISVVLSFPICGNLLWQPLIQSINLIKYYLQKQGRHSYGHFTYEKQVFMTDKRFLSWQLRITSKSNVFLHFLCHLSKSHLRKQGEMGSKKVILKLKDRIKKGKCVEEVFPHHDLYQSQGKN